MVAIQRTVQPVAPQQGPWVRPSRGYEKAPILVICDAMSEQATREKLPMEKENMKWFAEMLTGTGLDRYDFMFVALSPQLPKEVVGLDSQTWKFIEPHAAEIGDIIEKFQPKVVVPFGQYASRAVLGRAVKITKARGVPVLRAGKPAVMPMYSPWYVRRKPENLNVFKADVDMLSRIKAVGWNPGAITVPDTEYRWVSDLSELIDRKPPVIAIDTETTGLVWWKDETRVLTVQFTSRAGESLLAPIHPSYFRRVFPDLPLTQCRLLRRQVKAILEDLRIRKIGHHIKFDHQMLLKEGMEVRGWLHDTQLLAFFVDENIIEKSLDECVRLFVPEMSGYADLFNQSIDKSRMIDVPPEDVVDLEGKVVHFGMRNYAGGDTDATFRLAQRLDQALRRDSRAYNCYRKVQWPAMLAFTKTVERYGIFVNQDALRSLTQEVTEFVNTTRRELIALVPAPLRAEYLKNGEELSFSRAKVLIDILFGKKGFKLKPQRFTKSTERLPAKDRIPSTSTKDHLPYFKNEEGPAGEFVRKLIEYVQCEKLLSTYLGNEVERTGFWQYIAPDGAIYPYYKLHATVTGRSASENPNGQNFPKRGRFAKTYGQIFRARPGHKLVAADLSQIELRLAAWMAGEKNMIRIYRNDGDIHLATAEIAAGVPEGSYERHAKDQRILVEDRVADEFPGSGEWLRQLSPGERREATVAKFIKAQRQKAKAVNFGYLYSMSAEGFKEYAKTQYDVDLTLQEAETIRERYFKKYPGLVGWHTAMKAFVRKHGYVRSLHGAVRHLPSITSTDRGVVAEAERQAINSPIQRLGSDLGLMALWRFTFQADPERFRILGFVHDALVMEVRDGDEVEGLSALIYAMETLPLKEYFGIEPPLPIRSEGEIGLNLGKTYEIGDLPSEEKAPDWMKEIGLDNLRGLRGRRPEWWNDDWAQVEARYHARPTLLAA